MYFIRCTSFAQSCLSGQCSCASGKKSNRSTYIWTGSFGSEQVPGYQIVELDGLDGSQFLTIFIDLEKVVGCGTGLGAGCFRDASKILSI